MKRERETEKKEEDIAEGLLFFTESWLSNDFDKNGLVLRIIFDCC